MGRLFDDYGVNLGRIGANPNESLVGGASVEPEISEIPQDNALGGYAAMELDHLALVIEPDGAELKFAESCDFNNLLQMKRWGRLEKSGIGFSILEAGRRVRFIATERIGFLGGRSLRRWGGHKDKLDSTKEPSMGCLPHIARRATTYRPSDKTLSGQRRVW